MQKIIELLIISLATFRITRLITQDLITFSIREWILIRFPNDSQSHTWQKRDKNFSWFKKKGFSGKGLDDPWRKPTFLGNLISCDYCSSVWIAPALYILDKHHPQVVAVIAIAGIVYLISEHSNKDVY